VLIAVGAATALLASGMTVTVCVTVAGAGWTGATGSADALAPANPMTAAVPAATPPMATRQLRAFLFIAAVLLDMVRAG